MAGMAKWQAIVDSNLEQLNGLAKEFRNELENLKKEKYTIKLNIDEDKLNSAIKNLDKMLSNLGKGTGDFKEFQNLSKQFNSLVSDIQTLKKALGSIDDAGASELLSSIKNIDQSLSTLSQHIIDVNKDFSNIGKNANDNVNQINEAKKATEGLADATEKLANAQKNAEKTSNNSKKNRYKDKPKVSEDDYTSRADDYASIANQKLIKNGNTILGNSVNTELVDGLVKVNAKIKTVDGTWQTFSAKIDADGNMFEQRFRTITKNVDKLESELENFGRETSPKLSYQDTLDKAKQIRESLNLGDDFSIKVDSNELVTITQRLSSVDSVTTSVTQTFKSAEDAINNFALSASNAAEKTSVALKSVNNETVSSMESTLEQFEKQQVSLSIKPDDGHSFAKWTNKINELDEAVGEYRNLLASLKDKDIISDDDITQVTELEKRIKNLILTMQKTPMSERGYDNLSARKVAEQINSLLKENSAMSKQAKAQIRAYYDEVASGTATRPLKEIYNDALKVVQAEREMGRSGKSFFDAFKNKIWYGAAGQLAGMFGIYDIINVAKDGINVLNQFDDGLTTISYTMDLTKTQLDGLGESVVDMAKDLGTSIDNAMQVSQIYANLNTSAEEIKRLSEPTLILSNLTKFDASTVADDIQAVTQQFDIAAENSMHIADVYDYISKNIAVDYAKGIEGMADGLKVAGSTAQEAGLNFEQTASIIAKAMETTRLEGSQVGNGLKTILTRLSKVGELSGEVDNETLSKASESLHKIGVEVYNTDGAFRQFDVIIGELANKWDSLSDAEQANISFNIAA